MRKNPTRKIEKYRVRTGVLASDESFGANGMFLIPSKVLRVGQHVLPSCKVMCSDGSGWDSEMMGDVAWEHVSVSLEHRCPTWEEMCVIKHVFWRDEENVLQYHVPREEWVNNVNHCLHLWKPVGVEVIRPPALAVGVKDLGVIG